MSKHSNDLGQPATKRPVFSLSEASKVTGVSRSTIRRALDAEQFANAFRVNGDGSWMIPVEDLLQAGYAVNRPLPPDGLFTDTPPNTVVSAPEPVASNELRNLENQLVVTKADRDRWRAVADERERALERSDVALRMLDAGPQLRLVEPPAQKVVAWPWFLTVLVAASVLLVAFLAVSLV